VLKVPQVIEKKLKGRAREEEESKPQAMCTRHSPKCSLLKGAK
jgi:hypothetical protein